MGKINGNTLIDLGFKPDKWFKEVLTIANDKSLSVKELNELAIKFLREEEESKVEPFDKPKEYFLNIESDTEEEKNNLSQVIKSMDVLMTTPTVLSGSIMPDSCPTGEIGQIPVGGVVVTKNAIHPSMHSADICCSVMATNLGKVDPKKVLDLAHKSTHFGYVTNDNKMVDYKLSEDILERMKNNEFLSDEKSIRLAKTHLGTQGDGNHFLFVGSSENTKDIMMVTHHGSRGLGANLYKKGMLVAEKFRKKISPKTIKRNSWIPYNTKEGKDYWEALQIIRDWTKLNHKVIHDKVINDLNLKYDALTFWNEHNFVFKDEKDNFYHAKGATPLIDKFVPDSYNGLRIIPLNMSEPVLIVKGEYNETNLGFAPHGAGRNISRSAHKRKLKGRDVIDVFNEETKGLDIRFYSNDIDLSELPSAYKNAKSVQEQMDKFNLGEVVDRIYPYGCIMAGNIEVPWLKKNNK